MTDLAARRLVLDTLEPGLSSSGNEYVPVAQVEDARILKDATDRVLHLWNTYMSARAERSKSIRDQHDRTLSHVLFIAGIVVFTLQTAGLGMTVEKESWSNRQGVVAYLFLYALGMIIWVWYHHASLPMDYLAIAARSIHTAEKRERLFTPLTVRACVELLEKHPKTPARRDVTLQCFLDAQVLGTNEAGAMGPIVWPAASHNFADILARLKTRAGYGLLLDREARIDALVLTILVELVQARGRIG